jgi:uncharacterized protein (DUF488 family)
MIPVVVLLALGLRLVPDRAEITASSRRAEPAPRPERTASAGCPMAARACCQDCDMPTLTTIGVYCFTAETFLETLRAADVTLLVDVRQRRGVRGPRFTWANAQRLQALLAAAGIGYSHHRELAPSTELRHLQYREDDRMGVGKRSREILAAEYVSGYVTEILDPAPLEPLLAELPSTGVAALMCVECAAAACHRSLIAQRLVERYGFEVTHLTPPEAARTPEA